MAGWEQWGKWGGDAQTAAEIISKASPEHCVDGKGPSRASQNQKPNIRRAPSEQSLESVEFDKLLLLDFLC